MALSIKPITYRTACAFVNNEHRHHKAPQGHKFSVGLFNDNGVMVGCGMAGRPVARAMDDGTTLEITRLCTNGTRNACSMLYASLRKAGAAMGYRRIITYTLMSEDGASLRASGFVQTGENVGGHYWTGHSNTFKDAPMELKRRWEWNGN